MFSSKIFPLLKLSLGFSIFASVSSFAQDTVQAKIISAPIPEYLNTVYCKNIYANIDPVAINVNLLNPQATLTVVNKSGPNIFASDVVKVKFFKGRDGSRTEGFTYVTYISPAGNFAVDITDAEKSFYAEWFVKGKQQGVFSCAREPDSSL